MLLNPGHCPDHARGKRVRVRLAHGAIGASDNDPTKPPGWAADTTRWTLTGDRHDVAEYEVIG